MSLKSLIKGMSLSVGLTLLLSGGAWAQEAPRQKVLILTASIGMGHNSSANAIKAGLEARDPNVEVVVQDVREFSKNRVIKKINEVGYQLMVKYRPELWDRLFEGSMKKGRTANSMTEIDHPYNETALMEFISQVKPDMIVNTFNLGVASLISLRERGLLSRDIKISWMHTDYVVERFYMLYSKDIDMTFLPHPAMKEAWVQGGIPERNVKVTGMPVNPLIYQDMSSSEREQFLAEAGLDSHKKTIVLMSGAEGVGNFPEVVKGLAREFSEPVQIVAICGRNERHIKNLAKLQLPENVKLVVEGFIPNDRVLKYVKSSDLYITKSGGLSPTEAFVIGKPLVLLDINGGQERYNSIFFREQGLASVVGAENQAGLAARELLANPEAQRAMMAEQLKFRQSIDLEKITDYLVDGLADVARRTAPVKARVQTESVKKNELKISADRPAISCSGGVF